MPKGIYVRKERSSIYAAGTIHRTPTGTVEVLKELNKNPRILVVRFLDSGYVTECRASNLVSGKVKDHRKPSVYGVGFLDGMRVDPRGTGNRNVYDLWANMLKRCYAGYDACYEDCSVDKRWHSFKGFLNTITDIPGYEQFQNGENVHLDKDLRVPGNRVYSLDTCSFVPASTNLSDASNRRWAKD